MEQSSKYNYAGSELDLFVHAVNWKSYWSSFIYEYIKGDVLEVGAGKGTNTQILFSDRFSRWVCLEPDNEMAEQLSRSPDKAPYYGNYEVINGVITSLRKGQKFDTIIYIDVLEHIDNDKKELEIASELLRPGGNLIILSPALQALYSEFDKAIGHFRRYTKDSIERIVPSNLKVERLFYLDTIGILASMANRYLFKQRMPDLKQIKLWDRLIIPFSKRMDRLVGYRCGKSILAVLRLPE